MIGRSSRRALLVLALSTIADMPAARAVDLHLFADAGTTCAYLATAGAEDVARIEIWLTILQRDAAGGEARDRLLSTRGDVRRLNGEARTVEQAVTAIEMQIRQGHAVLRALREGTGGPQAAMVRAEIRATSEELIELSFDLRDAKARLAALHTAMAGRHDNAAMLDAAQSTARRSGRAIRECAMERRASLARRD